MDEVGRENTRPPLQRGQSCQHPQGRVRLHQSECSEAPCKPTFPARMPPSRHLLLFKGLCPLGPCWESWFFSEFLLCAMLPGHLQCMPLTPWVLESKTSRWRKAQAPSSKTDRLRKARHPQATCWGLLIGAPVICCLCKEGGVLHTGPPHSQKSGSIGCCRA